MRNSSDPFDGLQKLLALKRHEQPPPGYFDRLPGEILHRIRTERLPQPSWWDVLTEQHPWLQDVVRLLEARPLAASAVGAVAGALLLAAVFAGHQAAQPPIHPPVGTSGPAESQPTLFAGAFPGNPGFGSQTEILASTNPVAPSSPPMGLFDGRLINPQPVTFPLRP